MKKWTIPVTWEVFGLVTVKAESLSEAIERVRSDEDNLPLPSGEYVDGSFDVSYDDEDFVRSFYNNDQEDDS